MKNRIITPYNDVNELYKLKRYSSICIISDSPQEVVDFFIKEFNYEDLFDRGIGRGSELKDLDNIKPNPYFYNKLIKYIESKKFIYVGDTEKDREFAHNTGMKFILLSRKTEGSYSSLESIVSELITLIK